MQFSEASHNATQTGHSDSHEGLCSLGGAGLTCSLL